MRCCIKFRQIRPTPPPPTHTHMHTDQFLNFDTSYPPRIASTIIQDVMNGLKGKQVDSYSRIRSENANFVIDEQYA